jgi:hypothetical protein
VFSAPQLSLYEPNSLSELLQGKQVKEGTWVRVDPRRKTIELLKRA